MQVLLGNRFVAGYPSYHRGAGEVRVRVLLYANVAPIEGMYFVRPFSWRLVANYLREIEWRAVLRKVFSRYAERHRNAKFVSIGLGWVVESEDPSHRAGAPVAFVACRHPRCVDEIVVPAALACPLGEVPAGFERGGAIAHTTLSTDTDGLRRLVASVAGWDNESGLPVPAIHWPDVVQALSGLGRERCALVPLAGVTDGSPALPGERVRRQWDATLFGYGNYAKTIIIPYLPPPLRITRIHEVDPLQIPVPLRTYDWHTSPARDASDPNRIVFIAGYHHTHADLAIDALRQDHTAVVEKPIVVDRGQLDRLQQALATSAGRIFACFHKRYSPLNAFAIEDLDIGKGNPVSYHCIVYEVPLPRLHWYRWPKSHSSIVCNGCHWIDHFLWLNGYPDYERYDLSCGDDGTVNASVQLANGAFFTMVLTHRGSERIGVQEYVELRASDRTVRVINNARYEAESSRKLLRRRRVNKMGSYASMYTCIGHAVLAGAPGDSLRSVEVGSRLMLALDDALTQARLPAPQSACR